MEDALYRDQVDTILGLACKTFSTWGETLDEVLELVEDGKASIEFLGDEEDSCIMVTARGPLDRIWKSRV